MLLAFSVAYLLNKFVEDSSNKKFQHVPMIIKVDYRQNNVCLFIH